MRLTSSSMTESGMLTIDVAEPEPIGPWGAATVF